MTSAQLDQWIEGELPGFVDFTAACDPTISQIATKDGEVVGLYLCRRKDEVGDLANVAVVPQYRMLGLSRAMMFQCLNAMKAEGVDSGPSVHRHRFGQKCST